MNEQQQLTDQGKSEQYGLFVPRMVIHDLDPFQKALWLHYKDVCANAKHGICYEKVATTAKNARMAAGMITKTRAELEALGFIVVSEHPLYKTKCVEMVDIWPENMRRYAQRSPHETNMLLYIDSLDSKDQSSPNGEEKQQQLFIGVHSMNVDPRIQRLIDEDQLVPDVYLPSLMEWIARYGCDMVYERARWYLYERSQGKTRGGGWLNDALAKNWPKPHGFRDHMYLSQEENLARYGAAWDEIES